MNLRWVSKEAVLAIRQELIAEHGGSLGLREEGLLESALAKPRNLAAYCEPALSELAAAYAYGLARNHPFVDGNKRTAFVVAVTFLLLNGQDITASETEVVEIMSRLAAGKITASQLSSWFENCII